MDENERRKEILEILLKEYTIMRSEVRMYINKQYLALTAILAILTAGVFKSDSTAAGTTFIWIPFVVAAIVCFMGLVTFLINKTAGYVRLIEWRINQLYQTDFPNSRETHESKQYLAPMLWEGHYADIGMDRDKGQQISSVFGGPTSVLFVAAAIATIGILIVGFGQASNLHPVAGWFYMILALVILIWSVFTLVWTNTNVRQRVIEENIRLQTDFLTLVDKKLES